MYKRQFYPREDREALRQKYGIRRPFVVLMVANWISEKKGYGDIVRLADSLDGQCQVVLVGQNEFHLPIPENILYIPYTESVDELARLYSLADVCVNPSQYETFGKVTAEALCCGTPAVVYNNTASPELIGEGCGYVVEETEGAEGLRQAVERVRARGKAFYTERCLAFARERFSREKGVRAYTALYESCLLYTSPSPRD